MSARCSHVIEVRNVAPATPRECEECLRTAMSWVHLRLCLECGHVGCCDQSQGKHATGHFNKSHHPVMRSFERGEDWGWCYIDEIMMEPAPVPPSVR